MYISNGVTVVIAAFLQNIQCFHFDKNLNDDEFTCLGWGLFVIIIDIICHSFSATVKAHNG